MGRDPQAERRLAHRGSGADDVQGTRLESRQHLVEVGVAGGDARDGVAAIERLLQSVHRFGQELVELTGRVGDPLFGDLEHLGLGLVERFGDVVGFAVRDLGDVARDVDQPAQHRRVLDDLGVVAGARDRRCGVLQLVHGLRATDLVEQPGATQLVGNGDRVDGTAAGVQGADRVEDVLVGGPVEVGRAQALLADETDRLTRQQQRPEDGLLGLQVVRRNSPFAPPATVGCSRTVWLSFTWHGVSTLLGAAWGSLEAQPVNRRGKSAAPAVDTAGAATIRALDAPTGSGVSGRYDLDRDGE